MSELVVDAKAVKANILKLEAAFDEGVADSNLDVGLEILRLSQLEVPHDTGDLQNSGTVEQDDSGDVVIGYHRPYAARQHEHPEYKHQKGRKGKYLEDPIRKNEKALGLRFNKNLQDEVME